MANTPLPTASERSATPDTPSSNSNSSRLEKAVRETTQIYTTCLTVNNRKAFRMTCHQRFNDGTHRCKKLVTKTRSLILIPSVGIFNIRGGSRPKDRWLHLDRERICCRTCSQGIPSGPERSRSSSRRSSSSRCALVSGTVPGASLRLSHSPQSDADALQDSSRRCLARICS